MAEYIEDSIKIKVEVEVEVFFNLNLSLNLALILMHPKRKESGYGKCLVISRDGSGPREEKDHPSI
jgi:hypothetical protein